MSMLDIVLSMPYINLEIETFLFNPKQLFSFLTSHGRNRVHIDCVGETGLSSYCHSSW